AAHPAPPEAVRDNGHGARRRVLLFTRPKAAADPRLDAEDVEEIGGDRRRGHALRRRRSEQREVGSGGTGEVVEDLVLAPVDVVRIRTPSLRELPAGPRPQEMYEPIRIAVWQRAQERGIGDREDRGIRADPQ